MKRGEVYDARLDPVEGSEQRGSRPIVVVSRDAINESSPVVSAAPCTTYREGRHVYPSQVLVKAPEGGLEADSVVLGEQIWTERGCRRVRYQYARNATGAARPLSSAPAARRSAAGSGRSTAP
jgi:mRNA interferase MazF